MPNAPEAGEMQAKVPTADAGASAAALDLRGFHLRGAADSGDPLPAGFLPRSLHRLRDPDRIRTDWPLVLPDVPEGDVRFLGLPDALKSAAERSGGGRTLRDNLARAERQVRRAMNGAGDAAALGAVLDEAGRAVRAELALGPESDREFEREWRALTNAMPAGRLLPFSVTSPLVLFARAAADRVRPGRDALRREAQHLRAALESLLEAERGRQRSRDPQALREAVGTVGGGLVDPARLAELLGPPRGVERMEPERDLRIRETLLVLEHGVAALESPLVVFVHDGSLDGLSAAGDGVTLQVKGEPCEGALELARDEAERWTDLFRAVRVARLEVAGRFDPLRHVPWMAEFSPATFSREERAALPVFAAFDSADHVAGRGMASLSRLLRSGLAVHALVPVHPGRDPGEPGHAPLSGHRLELGYFGIGHRSAFVQQSAASHPAHLVEGFRRALAAPRPGLHVLAAAGVAADGMPDWLWSGAALEGRAHPFFRYDPEAGHTWSGRMDFSGNPEPGQDWPFHDADGARAEFTFADFALTDPALVTEFRAVSDEAATPELLEVPQWLALPEDEALRKIPFVHARDASGKPRRVVITRRLAAACVERRDFWRTLQELAGIRNEYVREAVQRALADAAAQHAEELALAKRDAAGMAMQALARRLLELDGGAGAWTAPSGAPAAPEVPAAGGAAPVPAAAGAAPAAASPAAGGGAETPWVESALCTTCNECININPQMFKYNADKQATIADPSKGTFQQLVRAAEKCPAKCIHPGDPLNPSEPNLDALKKRAAVFR